ncbi:MAG: hypothetical protein OXN83_02765, partial [Oligoflexia bacterium]|nr:hypothetical protein [Oligoflexia bacterium]
QGYSQSGSKLQLYKASSYYNKQTGSFCLNSLTKLKTGHTMEEFLEYLKISLKTDWESYFFQLLSPHDIEFINDLQYKGVFPKDFLESDSSLNWLWPLWKKIQLRSFCVRLSL